MHSKLRFSQTCLSCLLTPLRSLRVARHEISGRRLPVAKEILFKCRQYQRSSIVGELVVASTLVLYVYVERALGLQRWTRRAARKSSAFCFRDHAASAWDLPNLPAAVCNGNILRAVAQGGGVVLMMVCHILKGHQMTCLIRTTPSSMMLYFNSAGTIDDSQDCCRYLLPKFVIRSCLTRCKEVTPQTRVDHVTQL
jgi:hypothetical protein